MTDEIKRMKSFQAMFPNASASTVSANPHLVATDGGSGNKNVVQTNVKRLKPYPKKMLMNKTEAEFAQRLEIMKRKGEILRYEYQGMTLRWGVDSKTGDSMRYTPDFVVFVHQEKWTTRNGRLCNPMEIKLIEIKGPHIHYRQQAIARFKGCRSDWPEFQFEMHQKTKSGWKQIL